MRTKKLSVEQENKFTNGFTSEVTLTGNVDPNPTTIAPNDHKTFGFDQTNEIELIMACEGLPDLGILYNDNGITLLQNCEWKQIPAQESNEHIYYYAQPVIGALNVYFVTISRGNVGGGIAMVGTVSMIVPK